MNYMQILAYAEQLFNQIAPYWEYAKKELRTWLGPEPLTYYLLTDGRVLPSTITLPDEVKAETFTFDPFLKRMKKSLGEQEGRLRPLPFIGIVLKTPSFEVDISEWLGELRAFPNPEFVTAKQLILLWSHVHNKYITFQNGSLLLVKNDGTEETVDL